MSSTKDIATVNISTYLNFIMRSSVHQRRYFLPKVLGINCKISMILKLVLSKLIVDLKMKSGSQPVIVKSGKIIYNKNSEMARVLTMSDHIGR